MIGFIHPSMIGVGRLVDARRLWEPPYLCPFRLMSRAVECGGAATGERRCPFLLYVVICL